MRRAASVSLSLTSAPCAKLSRIRVQTHSQSPIHSSSDPKNLPFELSNSTISHFLPRKRAATTSRAPHKPKSRPTCLNTAPQSSNLTKSFDIIVRSKVERPGRSNEHLMNYCDVERLSRPIFKVKYLNLCWADLLVLTWMAVPLVARALRLMGLCK